MFNTHGKRNNNNHTTPNNNNNCARACHASMPRMHARCTCESFRLRHSLKTNVRQRLKSSQSTMRGSQKERHRPAGTCHLRAHTLSTQHNAHAHTRRHTYSRILRGSHAAHTKRATRHTRSTRCTLRTRSTRSNPTRTRTAHEGHAHVDKHTLRGSVKR